MKKFFSQTKSPMVFPRPVALVTCRYGKIDNIITLSWVGVVCSEPPIVACGIRKNRFSYGVIKKSKEFVINIPEKKLVEEADFCGTRTGEEVDKFKKTGLTKQKAKNVNVPMIKECPINLECKLLKTINMGSHTVFFGEVVGTHIDSSIMTNRKFDDKKFEPLLYLSPHYFTVKEIKKEYGFTK